MIQRRFFLIFILLSCISGQSSSFKSFFSRFTRNNKLETTTDSTETIILTQASNQSHIEGTDYSNEENKVIDNVREVVIIGSGPSGCTAAIYTSRALLRPLVIGGWQAGGQLMLTNDVENFPGYLNAVDGPTMMGDLIGQARKFGAEFWMINVVRVNTSTYPYAIELHNTTVYTKSIIISTGADSIWLNAVDEDIYRGKGISTCATCDGYIFRNKSVIVIGGGDSAMEEATFLTRFASSVTIIHRSSSFRASKLMLQRAVENPKVRFMTDTVVESWTGAGDVLTGAVLKNLTSLETSSVRFITYIYPGYLNICNIYYIIYTLLYIVRIHN